MRSFAESLIDQFLRTKVEPSVKRIGAIDFVRGLMLLQMSWDHFLWFPFQAHQAWTNYTYEALGFVSAAEGFVCLSGMAAAVAYVS